MLWLLMPVNMASQRRTFMAASTAGALQDHLLHDLAIGDLSLGNPLRSYTNLKQRLRNDEKKRKMALKNIKPTLDTGRSRKKNSIRVKAEDSDPEREYVLDPLPKPSLAQKMGLVSQPDKPLTHEEWLSVKERSIARDDFQNPCAICQEYFKTEDQVLLSCSHVFHKACIQAFERFTGKKTCPMCRKIQYEARVVHDGTKVYKIRAAVRIQSLWRGYVVRKWYRELRRTVAPKDPRLRQRFYEDKLQEITDRMVAMMSSDRVDRFLQDIDESIASSRAIFQHFEDSCLHRLSEENWIEIEIKALERDVNDCPICLRSLHPKMVKSEGSHITDRDLKKKSARRDKKVINSPANANSQTKSAKSSPATATITEGSTTVERISLALLSCSHLFHSKCLVALEDFCLMESPMQTLNYGTLNSPIMQQHMNFKCPVCRSLYVKRIL